jgi:hypothetical protein
MKGGRSTSTGGWKKWKTSVVSLDGLIGVFRAHAHTIWMYFPLHEQGLVSGRIMLMEVG